MTLKSLSKIEFLCNVVIGIIMFPFVVIEIILQILEIPFSYVKDGLVVIRQIVGNRLLKMSDEVKEGKIKNDYCLRVYTARFALKELNREAKLD
jgi:hypothetical protein